MKENLKEEGVKGLIWLFFDRIGFQVVRFFIAIFLTRLLSPIEYGLIGMVGIFILVANLFVESGLGSAIIRVDEIGDEELTAIFVYNTSVSIFFYLVLYISAPFIALFYNEFILIEVIRLLGLALIINSFSSVQASLLTRSLKYKSLSFANVLSSAISGFVAVIFAYLGYGVKALIIMTLIQALVKSVYIWKISTWKPTFSKIDYKKSQPLFSFGWKILSTALSGHIIRNSVNVIIGKSFGVVPLGYFTQAKSLMEIPSMNIQYIFENISYPILAKVKGDNQKLKSAYKKIYIGFSFLIFPAMLGLIAISEDFVRILLTEKWMPTVPLLWFVSLYGMFNPMNSINVNILKVRNEMKMYMKLAYLNQALFFVTIVICSFGGVQILAVGFGVQAVVTFLINSYFCGKSIGYSIIEQLKDLFEPLKISLLMILSIMLIGYGVEINNVYLLLCQISIGILVYFFLFRFTNKTLFDEIKSVIWK
ncbi:MAG: Teichuronic acid biosynthesis protein TuaB [Ignavibacteriaceae bacterium]|nr:Teichuronic acid biosynthesis protein TuaB [Ignavibacteriaceae bacterium]